MERHVEAEETDQAVIQAEALRIYKDPEVRRLRRRIEALDGRIKKLEARFPSNCDPESVEMYMSGALDKPAKDFMDVFLGQHAVLRDYCDALLRRALLERVLVATIRKCIDARVPDVAVN